LISPLRLIETGLLISNKTMEAAMQTTASPKTKRKGKTYSASVTDRRNKNRRKKAREGYTYIPMVGWYCRREKERRGDESR
jgi:uncharacterized membrane-anchored protein YitT (DUF2179 family)